jgi:hypothetical protein
MQRSEEPDMTFPQHKKIKGYSGPTGPYAVVRGRLGPLTDPQALIGLTDAALLAGLGLTDKAREYADIAAGHGAVHA